MKDDDITLQIGKKVEIILCAGVNINNKREQQMNFESGARFITFHSRELSLISNDVSRIRKGPAPLTQHKELSMSAMSHIAPSLWPAEKWHIRSLFN